MSGRYSQPSQNRDAGVVSSETNENLAYSRALAALRRKARRHGFRFEKSRQRHRHTNNQGGLMLLRVYDNTVVAGSTFDLSISEASWWLWRSIKEAELRESGAEVGQTFEDSYFDYESHTYQSASLTFHGDGFVAERVIRGLKWRTGIRRKAAPRATDKDPGS